MVELIHSTLNGDNLIAEMARVSNPANQKNTVTAPKLINYLIKHQHWSPFEMVSMCVKINTTRSIASQILRHRTFSFQEFSQRYAPVVNVANPPHLRSQDIKNRQNSIDDLNPFLVQDFQIKTQLLFKEAFDLYNQMLDVGIAKECARDVLPLATETTLYMHGTLRSWYHYVLLRTANGTQLEHQQIADEIKLLIATQFPQCYVAMFNDDECTSKNT